MSGWLRTRLGRAEAEVEPFRPAREETEGVVLLGPGDPDPVDVEARTRIVRLSFDLAATGAILADDVWDLSRLSDEELDELYVAVGGKIEEAAALEAEVAKVEAKRPTPHRPPFDGPTPCRSRG